jgi:probable phosphoglycerate mutase
MSLFYLIRHGTIATIGHSIAGRAPGVHLTDEGRWQADALAERLAREPITRIYSSPLERARETAAPIAQRLGLQTAVADEIAELDFGAWTGRTMNELEQSSQWKLFNTFRSGTQMPGGEWMLQVQSRAVLFLQGLRNQFPGEQIAVVSHGDVIRAVLLYYLGMPLDLILRLEVSPGSISVLRLDQYGPQVLAVNVAPVV